MATPASRMQQYGGVSGLHHQPGQPAAAECSGRHRRHQPCRATFRRPASACCMHLPDPQRNPKSALLTLAEQQGWQLEQLTPLQSTLEEVFAQITEAEPATAGETNDPPARPARTAQPVLDAVHLVHLRRAAIHPGVVLSGTAGRVSGSATAAGTTRQSARGDQPGRRTDVQYGRAAADDAGADVHDAPDRRGTPQPDLCAAALGTVVRPPYRARKIPGLDDLSGRADVRRAADALYPGARHSISTTVCC